MMLINVLKCAADLSSDVSPVLDFPKELSEMFDPTKGEFSSAAR